MLTEATHGRMGALVLVGADPLADFPDSGLALRGLLGARFVVAVDTHLNESTRRADVVLPASAWAERRGTFTNLEGRITWLSQLLVEHSVSWPDWMIATELAARMGVNLAFTRLEDIWAEIERVSPLHHGIPYHVFAGVRARDGVVVPIDPAVVGRVLSRALFSTPWPTPASRRPNWQQTSHPSALLVTFGGQLPASGQRHDLDRAVLTHPELPESGATGEGVPAVPTPPRVCPQVPVPSRRPSSGRPAPAATAHHVGRRCSRSRRSSRSPAWLPADAAGPGAHPAVLAELGAAEGEKVVLLRGQKRGTLRPRPRPTPPACRPGPAGVLPWNLPGARAGDLIDSTTVVTTVTVEASGGDD